MEDQLDRAEDQQGRAEDRRDRADVSVEEGISAEEGSAVTAQSQSLI